MGRKTSKKRANNRDRDDHTRVFPLRRNQRTKCELLVRTPSSRDFDLSVSARFLPARTIGNAIFCPTSSNRLQIVNIIEPGLQTTGKLKGDQTYSSE